MQPGAAHRGDVRWTIDLPLGVPSSTRIDPAQTSFEVHAVEVVHVPSGGYWLGDEEPAAHAHAAFFRSGGEGRPAGLYRVEGEGSIEVGPGEGQLWYLTSERTAQYEGDRAGPVPDAFPKGTQAFYCMKYELSQGEYAAFLNSIAEGGANARAIHASVRYAELRGTISIEGGRFVAASPRRPCNFISWDDACAWADWAGLRPMTELEFTKACRGSRRPAQRDFPWGSASKDALRRVIDESTMDLVTHGAADESLLADDTRDVFGASEWWIMDLAGSVWERCVTIGHPAGRAFAGTHGDGRVTAYARATNEDWPRGDEGQGGYGYRGGGYYEPAHHAAPRPDDFNPWSPVEWRRFGSWGDAPRTMAYGFRAVRTASEPSQTR